MVHKHKVKGCRLQGRRIITQASTHLGPKRNGVNRRENDLERVHRDQQEALRNGDHSEPHLLAADRDQVPLLPARHLDPDLPPVLDQQHRIRNDEQAQRNDVRCQLGEKHEFLVRGRHLNTVKLVLFGFDVNSTCDVQEPHFI